METLTGHIRIVVCTTGNHPTAGTVEVIGGDEAIWDTRGQGACSVKGHRRIQRNGEKFAC